MQVGLLLPNSRSHELEADKFGLFIAAMAGYNPREAIPFWQRMSQGGGQKPPEFLATHPSDEKRIAQLESFMPQALKLYKPVKSNRSQVIKSPFMTGIFYYWLSTKTQRPK